MRSPGLEQTRWGSGLTPGRGQTLSFRTSEKPQLVSWGCWGKVLHTGGSNSRNVWPPVLEARTLRPRCGQVGPPEGLSETLQLLVTSAVPRLADGATMCLPTFPLSTLISLCIHIPLFIRTHTATGLGPTLMPYFNLITCKDPISITSHSQVLGIKTSTFGEDGEGGHYPTPKNSLSFVVLCL